MPSAQTAPRWCPDECRITGRKLFMWIEHPDGGMVPTYGGPFDSYTIPTRDGDEGFCCERYDHDYGGWRDDEMVGLKLIDDQSDECEHGQVAELQAEIERLKGQSRTMVSPAPVSQPGLDQIGVLRQAARAGDRRAQQELGLIED